MRSSRRFNLLSLTSLVLFSLSGCFDGGPQGDQEISLTSSEISLKDTYLKSGSANKNQGSDTEVVIKDSGNNRALIQFELSAIDTVLTGKILQKAELEFTVSSNGNNWGSSGRLVDVHRMTQSWTEAGATWNCAIDTDPTNSAKDCSGATEWEMGNGSNPWEFQPSYSFIVQNNQSGTVRVNITDDLKKFLNNEVSNYGFIIKKTDESQNGRIEFSSKEGSNPPTLVLSVSDSPNAIDDEYETFESRSLVMDVLLNDQVVSGETLSIVSFTQGTLGSVQSYSSSELLYIPSSTGSDSFTYTIEDSVGNQSTATVSVEIKTIFQAHESKTIDLKSNGDTFVRSGGSNSNEGGSLELEIQSSGKNRTLIQFSDDFITELQNLPDSYELDTATLEFTISQNGNNLGSSGRNIDIHRMTQVWEERRATWNCATDSDPTNSSKDCSGAFVWEMGNGSNPWSASVTDSVLITNDQSGVVQFNVTSDVELIAQGTAVNAGWIVKLSNESQDGKVFFHSMETANPPKLTLTYSDTNTVPNAMDDSVSLTSGSEIDIDVLSNDTDPDAGDSISVTSITQGSQGTVSLNPNGTLKYTLIGSTQSSDEFFYTIQDNYGAQDTAKVTVNFPTDSNPPVITTDLTTPVLTNNSSLSFNVMISDASSTNTRVLLNSVEILQSSNFTFPVNLTLAEGLNVIEIESTDSVGNVGTLVISDITLDTIAPVLSNLVPAANDTVSTLTFPVSGDSNEQLSSITLNSQALTISGNTFTGSYTASQEGSLVLTWDATDLAGNTVQVSYSITVDTGGSTTLPPNPEDVAPALSQNTPSTFLESVSFLFSGTNPIQTGLNPLALEERRVAVIRGKILKNDLSPLEGVKIEILNHPEFGQTLTRADGEFDLVVNGGGYLFIEATKSGYFPVQRQVNTPWNDYTVIEDAILTQADSLVTNVDFSGSSNVVQVHQASSVTDASGTRKAVLMFPPQTTAQIRLSNGSLQSVSNLNIRATEYTVGDNGPLAMPAKLPPYTDYTYAVELSADEAIAQGATEILFDKKVSLYIDNFLGFSDGGAVPVGFYSRTQSKWIAEENGRIVKILSINSGVAELDVNGTGSPATSQELSDLGITTDELTQLGGLYSVGKSLWRVTTDHFSPFDMNWAVAVPIGTSLSGLNVSFPLNEKYFSSPELVCRSVIEVENRNLREEVNLAGSPFKLHYASSRVKGNLSKNQIRIPLTPSALPASLTEIIVGVTVAGQQHLSTFPADPDLEFTFDWDGLDAFGREIQGAQRIIINIGYIFQGEYVEVASQFEAAFGRPLPALSTSGIGSREGFISLPRSWEGTIGGLDVEGYGVGGWTLTNHHAYDPTDRKLYLGDGRIQDGKLLGPILVKIAGQDNIGFSGDGGPAINAEIGRAWDMDFGPDGSLYIADQFNDRIRKIDPNGVITTVVGSNNANVSPYGDGGQADQAVLSNPNSISVGVDGSLYIADVAHNRIRKVTPSGIISTIVQSGQTSVRQTATQTQNITLGTIQFAEVAPDDSVYFVANGMVHRLGTDGSIRVVVGGASFTPSSFMAEGVSALDINPSVNQIAVDNTGNLYISSGGPSSSRVIQVQQDGRAYTIAGIGTFGFSGDGGLATQAKLSNPQGIKFGPDGSLYIAELSNRRIRRVTPDGMIDTFAGNGNSSVSGIGGLARQASITEPIGLAVDQVGSVYVGTDASIGNIYKILNFFPGLSNNEILLSSEDGSEVFKFNGKGQHLETRTSLTNHLKYQFSYSSNGKLTQVVDSFGNTTTVERDGNEEPTAIIAPELQRTELTIDADSYLSSIINPKLESYSMVYGFGQNGLLDTFTSPNTGSVGFMYDALGRFKKETDPLSGFIDLISSNIDDGVYIQKQTALSRTTTHQTQTLANGNILESYVNEVGGTRTRTTSTAGTEVTTLVDGTVISTTVGPDSRFGLATPTLKSQSITTPFGNVMNVSVNETAVLSDVNDPFSVVSINRDTTINSKTFNSFYDASTKTRTNSTPEGRQTVSIIDANEKITQEQVSGLTSIGFSYDASGKLSSITQGPRSTTFTYNTNGYLEKITNPLAQDVNFTYDNAGRVITQTLNDGRVIGFDYDTNGNLKEITPPGKPKHEFFYNLINLFTDYTPPAIGGAVTTTREYNLDRQLTKITRPDGKVIDFVYDGDVPADPNTGQLKEIQTLSGNYTFSYFGTGNLQALTSPDNVNLSFSYDGSLPTVTTWSGNVSGSVTNVYNTDFRVSNEFVNGANSSLYTYDNDGLLIGVGAESIVRDANHGLLKQASIGSMVEDFDYNSFGELDTQEAKFGATTLYSAAIVRDSLGRISTKSETVQGTTSNYVYNYDSTGRLDTVIKDAVQIADYDYDSNSNRTLLTTTTQTFSGSYDDQDRLTSYGNLNFTYNQYGDLLSKTDTSTSQTTNYVYDSLGNLKSVTLPNTDVIEYLVDGRNRRVARKLNGAFTSKYLYRDQLNPVAELDGSNAVVSRFVYGAKANVPDYMVKGGVTYKIVSDHLGSVRLVVDTSSGTIVQRMDYDEFGVVTQDTNPGFQPFGFAGGLFDSSTGLARFGARDYSAEIGRWTNKDPILFEGRDTNLYGYVLSDPVNFKDVNGLFSEAFFVPGGLLFGNPFGLGQQFGREAEQFVPVAAAGAITGVSLGAIAGIGITAGVGSSVSVVTKSFTDATLALCASNPQACIIASEVGLGAAAGALDACSGSSGISVPGVGAFSQIGTNIIFSTIGQ